MISLQPLNASAAPSKFASPSPEKTLHLPDKSCSKSSTWHRTLLYQGSASCPSANRSLFLSLLRSNGFIQPLNLRNISTHRTAIPFAGVGRGCGSGQNVGDVVESNGGCVNYDYETCSVDAFLRSHLVLSSSNFASWFIFREKQRSEPPCHTFPKAVSHSRSARWQMSAVF